RQWQEPATAPVRRSLRRQCDEAPGTMRLAHAQRSSLHRNIGEGPSSGDMHIDAGNILWRCGKNSREYCTLPGLHEVAVEDARARADPVLTAADQVAFLFPGGDKNAVDTATVHRFVFVRGGILDPIAEKATDLNIVHVRIVLQAELHGHDLVLDRDAIEHDHRV